jgi:hypothetical protein
MDALFFASPFFPALMVVSLWLETAQDLLRNRLYRETASARPSEEFD